MLFQCGKALRKLNAASTNSRGKAEDQVEGPERGSISNQNGIETGKPEAEEAFLSDASYFLVEIGDEVIE